MGFRSFLRKALPFIEAGSVVGGPLAVLGTQVLTIYLKPNSKEDQLSRLLNDLSPIFKPKAIELLARLAEAGIPCMVVDTLRTPEEHAENLANGTSWTKHSKHLDGLAIDICPYESFLLHGPDKLEWDTEDPIWQKIGPIGEKLGLRWGGRWAQKDMGHFEFVGMS